MKTTMKMRKKEMSFIFGLQYLSSLLLLSKDSEDLNTKAVSI